MMKRFLPVMVFLVMVPTIGWSQAFLQVSSLSGKVEFRSAASKTFQPLNVSVRQVQVGDEIKTGPGASVVLQLPDTSYMVVQENSEVQIRDFWSGGLRNIVNLALGRVRFYINHFGGQPNPYRVQTPTALIAVRGTIFDVDVDGGANTEVSCLDGSVGVESLGTNREVLLTPGLHTLVQPGQPPSKPVAQNEELSPNRTLHIQKKGADAEKALDPKVVEKLLKDNDRNNRPGDRYKTPTSGIESNVGRAKMSYPE